MSAAIVLTQAAGGVQALHRLAMPGAAAAMAYRSAEADDGAALVQYYPGGAPPLSGGPEDAGVSRYRARLVSDTGPVAEQAPVLMIVAFDVPAARAAEVERWYAIEHIELLMRAPGWLRARRYEMQEFTGARRFTSLALHELRSVAVLESAERAYARRTAWRAVLEREAWFAAAGRFIYERVQLPGT